MNLERKDACVRQMICAAKSAMAISVAASPASTPRQRLICRSDLLVCDKYIGHVEKHYRSRTHIARVARQSQDNDRSHGPCGYKDSDYIEDKPAWARCLSQRTEVVDCQPDHEQRSRTLDKPEDEDVEKIAQIVELHDVRGGLIIGERADLLQ